VGNRLFTNQVVFLTRGYSDWMYALEQGHVRLDSDIVEIGCGCGRLTRQIAEYRLRGSIYSGKYLGIDIDKEMIDWCEAHFDDRFEFALSTHGSTSYIPSDEKTGAYSIPRDDRSVDYVYGTSLLTHLLEAEMVNYLAESARILRPRSWIYLSCFAVDRATRHAGSRHTFQHRIANAYVESMAQPQAAVAYQSDFLVESALNAGFAFAEVQSAPGDVQHALLARTPD
tara:strand:- start:3149 stop:3829 length:681 start_codon:yes stop_codon:yes gene_type:complete